jgi:hypothetical protein
MMTDHSIAAARLLMADTLPLGQHVRVVGGFDDGLTGSIVGVRQRAQTSPYSSDYPVFYIWTGADLIGGYSAVNLEPVLLTDGAPDREPVGYVLECYGCGAWGTNHVFGFGNGRQCPACGSYEVHSP